MSSSTSADPLVLRMAANRTLSGPAALNRIPQDSDPGRVDIFASYRTKVLGRDAGFR